MIQFRCQACKEVLNVADNHAGHSGRCPKCGQPVHVPTAVPVHRHKAHRSTRAGHPTVEGRNAAAIAGMVFAAVAVLFGLILSVPLLREMFGSSGPSTMTGLVAVCYVLMCLSAVLGLVFSILGLRRARSAGWGTRLPMAGLVLSCVLVVLDATLSTTIIRMQRELTGWVDDSYRQLRDQGPNELEP